MVPGGKVLPQKAYDTVFLFRSTDMVDWKYVRPFYEPNREWTGPEEDCACLDFLRLGERHMLLCISHLRGCRYYLGRYEDEAFVPEEHHRVKGKLKEHIIATQKGPAGCTQPDLSALPSNRLTQNPRDRSWRAISIHLHH